MADDWNDVDLGTMYRKLEDISDDFDNLMEWCDDMGYRAVQHKLQEAMGPLMSAMSATVQYDNGELEVRE